MPKTPHQIGQEIPKSGRFAKRQEMQFRKTIILPKHPANLEKKIGNFEAFLQFCTIPKML
jgi:hypothetical protein